MDGRIVADSDRHPQPRENRSTAVAFAVLALVVAIGVLIAVSGKDPPPSETPFDPLVAGEVSEDWWRNVIARNDSAAASISHPDSNFDFELLGEASPDASSTVVVVIDAVPFGTTEAPQLCYILLTPDDQYTGSIVYRVHQGVWLPWKVVRDSQNCFVPPRPSG